MAVRSSSRRDDEDALDPVEAADEAGVDEVDELTADAVIEGEGDFADDDDVDDLPAQPAADPGFEDDEPVVVVVEDDDEVEGVRDGEFVCRSCYMAKRETQLADPARLLCRDCA